jgi:type IV pilus assembly protein PilB
MADEGTITQRLFDALVERRLVTPEQVTHARELHSQTKQPLGQVLVARGLITADDVKEVLEEELGVPRVDLASYAPEPDALRLVPATLAQTRKVLPLFEIEGMLTVAVADPLDVFDMDELADQLSYELEPVLSDARDIEDAIKANYGGQQGQEAVAAPAAKAPGPAKDAPAAEAAATAPEPVVAGAPAMAAPVVTGGAIDLDVLAVADATTTVLLMTDILQAAQDTGASHVHVDPGPDEFELVFRVGDELRAIARAAVGFESALLRTARIMAHLRAEASGPATGRMRVYLRDSEVTVGLSILPTVHGERLVLALGEADSGAPASLDAAGMADEERQALAGAFKAGGGLVLVSGPVFSGRSSTYRSILAERHAAGVTALSIEDRVERDLDGVWQVELAPAQGLDAAAALGAALRQDADVLGLDELRTATEAHLLLQAAASGRTVVATTVGGDGVDTIARLTGQGVEPHSLSRRLAAVVSQRLVAVNCEACKTQYVSDLAQEVDFAGQLLTLRGKGCQACGGTGLGAPIGVFEVLVPQAGLRAAIARGADEEELRAAAARDGVRPLLENGYRLVGEGVVNLEELDRALPFTRG